MFKKAVRLLFAAALTVSMIVPPATVVLAADGHTVDATGEDRQENLGNIKTSDVNDACVRVNVDNGHKATITTGSLEAEKATAIEIEAKTGSADVFIDGDAVSWDSDNSSYGVSLYAGEDQNNTKADVKLTVKGNTQGATAGARIMATDGSTNETVIEGSAIGIKNNEGDAFGLVVETRDDFHPGDREKSAKATVIVKGDCIATENTKDKGATIRGNGGFTDVYIGGNVAGDTGMEVQSFFNGQANVVVEGTVYGEMVGISLDAEEGKDSKVTAWKIEAGQGGTIVGNLVAGKPVEDKAAEKKIQYIVKTEQPEGATLTVTYADGNALPTVTAANGKTFEYAHSGDKLLLKVDTDKDYNIDAVYCDEAKSEKLDKDDAGNYCIEVPEGGGVYFCAAISKRVEYTIDVKTEGEGEATANCAGSAAGQEVTVTAKPKKDSKFMNWTSSEGVTFADAKSESTTFTMPEGNVTITAVFASDISKATVKKIKDKTYTGKAVKPSPVVKFNGKKLKAGTDYTIEYKKNKNAGTATIIITGKGRFTGSVKKSFKIKKAANKLSVNAKNNTYNVNASSLKDKKQSINGKKIYKFTNKKKTGGEIKYKLVSVKKDGKTVKDVFSVNSKSGKLDINQGVANGSYTVTVKVTAGDKNYKTVKANVTFDVKIK